MTSRARRVLLVGDNRYNVNWGARSASVALSQLIGRRFEVVDRIDGRAFHVGSSKFGYVRTLMPSSRSAWFHYALSNSAQRRVYGWYVALERLFGAHDFVRPDPVETARDIIALSHRYPFLERIRSAVQSADVVVVNGEGDFVFTTPPRREALFMLGVIELAALLGKPVAFVNALMSDCPTTGRNVQTLEATRAALRKCFKICLRDSMSYDFVRTHMPEIACSLVPDSLFSWYPTLSRSRNDLPHNGDYLIPFPEQDEQFGQLRFDTDYICVGGGATASSLAEAIPAYCNLVRRLKAEGLRVILITADGNDSFLAEVGRLTDTPQVPASTPVLLAGAVLANARLLISGRYHATILAALGGTPSILLKTSAHKMESLGALLGLPEWACFPTLPAASDLDALVSAARGLIASDGNWRAVVSGSARELCTRVEQLPDIVAEALANVSKSESVTPIDNPQPALQS